MHPSIRDLVIDHVAVSPALRASFLQNAGVDGIKLGLSRAGGSVGERELPFLQTDEDWLALSSRMAELIHDGSSDVASALLAELVGLAELAENNPTGGATPSVRTLISGALRELAMRWNTAAVPIPITELEAYCQTSLATSPPSPLPALDATWAQAVANLASGDDLGDSIELFQRLVILCKENEPRFLTQVEWPDAFSEMLGQVIEYARTEIGQESHFVEPDDPEDLPGENPVEGWLPSLNAALVSLEGVVPDETWPQIEGLTEDGYALEASWDEYDAIRQDDEVGWEGYGDTEPSEVFDLDEFFADL